MPLAFMGLGVQELVIILVIILLLFGGSRLAGLGKSTGRALKEFKEETKGLGGNKDADQDGVKDQLSDPPPPAPRVTPPPAPQVTSGETPPAAPPAWQQPPANLADPSTNDVRKDV